MISDQSEQNASKQAMMRQHSSLAPKFAPTRPQTAPDNNNPPQQQFFVAPAAAAAAAHRPSLDNSTTTIIPRPASSSTPAGDLKQTTFLHRAAGPLQSSRLNNNNDSSIQQKMSKANSMFMMMQNDQSNSNNNTNMPPNLSSSLNMKSYSFASSGRNHLFSGAPKNTTGNSRSINNNNNLTTRKESSSVDEPTSPMASTARPEHPPYMSKSYNVEPNIHHHQNNNSKTNTLLDHVGEEMTTRPRASTVPIPAIQVNDNNNNDPRRTGDEAFGSPMLPQHSPFTTSVLLSQHANSNNTNNTNRHERTESNYSNTSSNQNHNNSGFPTSNSNRQSRRASRTNVVNNNNTNRTSLASPLYSPNSHHQQQQDLLDEDPIFRLWLRQHPDADATAIAAQKYRRTKEIADAERTERIHGLKKLQQDLARLESIDELSHQDKQQRQELQNVNAAFLASSALSPTSNFETPDMKSGGGGPQQFFVASPLSGGRTPTTPQSTLNSNTNNFPASSSVNNSSNQNASNNNNNQGATASSSGKMRVLDAIQNAESEAQKLAWLSFHGIIDETQQPQPKLNNLLSSPQQNREDLHAINNSININSGSGPISSSILGGVTKGELALIGWYDDKGNWHMSTDRHENAATCIQCAFRCFMAKRRAVQRRRTRERTVQKIMAAEASLEYAWLAATSVNKDSADSHLSSEVDKTIRIMGKFAERFRAVVARRRKRIAREREVWDETMLYAVVRIQACVRGFLVRQEVELVRNPEIAIARQEAIGNQAATEIQRIARGRLARVNNLKRRNAAVKIQSIYRRHLCMFRAAQLRRVQRVYADAEVSDFAARVIQRFMRSLVVRRLQSLQVHKKQVRLLQAVGRGYQARRSGADLFHGMVNEAAVDIQRMFKGWYARNVYVSGLVSAHKHAMEAALQQHAACIVTRAFRKAKIFAEQRQTVLENVAATEIQRLARGHAARKEYVKVRAAEQERIELQQQENSATVIQTAVRGYLCRKKFLEQTGRIKKKQQSRRSSRPSSASSRKSGAGGGGGGVATEPIVDEDNNSAVVVEDDNLIDNNNNNIDNEDLDEKIQSTPENNKAAEVLQKFFKQHIRRRLLRTYLDHKATIVQKFMRGLRFRKVLVQLHKAKNEQKLKEEHESIDLEKILAANNIKNFIRARIDRRKLLLAAKEDDASPVRQRKLAAEEKKVQLDSESNDHEKLFSVIKIQKNVREFLVRRYMRILKRIEEEREEDADKNLWPSGVNSYEAACALRRYYAKHAGDSAKKKTAPPVDVEEEEEL